jgi:hypothetical protein
VISRFFHAWERRLASVDLTRVVRPFEWGLDWLDLPTNIPDPTEAIVSHAGNAMRDSDAFFRAPRLSEFERDGNLVRFPSAYKTPHPENNTVTLRVFPARERKPGQPKRAVLVLPQWNANPGGHVGLCEGLAYFGITAVRLMMPYHETRRPADLARSEYIVGTNVGRTLQANRQAVLDARRALDWIEDQGHERIGIMGTSLGSCLAMLTMCHDTRVKTGAFNHVSPYFADVVWQGLSTQHVRRGLEGNITLEALRQAWMPISPWPFIERVKDRKILLIHARYDLTFPVDLSKSFLEEFKERGVAFDEAVLPCGHYTTGRAPFKFLDGYWLIAHFLRYL